MRFRVSFDIELFDDETVRTAEDIEKEMKKYQAFECPALDMRVSERTADTIKVTLIEEIKEDLV